MFVFSVFASVVLICNFSDLFWPPRCQNYWKTRRRNNIIWKMSTRVRPPIAPPPLCGRVFSPLPLLFQNKSRLPKSSAAAGLLKPGLPLLYSRILPAPILPRRSPVCLCLSSPDAHLPGLWSPLTYLSSKKTKNPTTNRPAVFLCLLLLPRRSKYFIIMQATSLFLLPLIKKKRQIQPQPLSLNHSFHFFFLLPF